MQVYSGTGVTSTPKIALSKGISGLMFHTDLAFAALNTEAISIEIESPYGNRKITDGFMPLRDFIMLCMYGNPAITPYDATYKTSVSFDICKGGAVLLRDKE